MIHTVSVPSLEQIAAYHINRNAELIKERYGHCPVSISSYLESKKSFVDGYLESKSSNQPEILTDGSLQINLFSFRSCFTKDLLGLTTGTFLTIRSRNSRQGTVGEIINCPICNLPATQTHFLNSCRVGDQARKLILNSVSAGITIQHLSDRDFGEYFKNLRNIRIRIPKELEITQFLEELSQVTALAGSKIVKETLILMPNSES